MAKIATNDTKSYLDRLFGFLVRRSKKHKKQKQNDAAFIQRTRSDADLHGKGKLDVVVEQQDGHSAAAPNRWDGGFAVPIARLCGAAPCGKGDKAGGSGPALPQAAQAAPKVLGDAGRLWRAGALLGRAGQKAHHVVPGLPHGAAP